MTVPPPQPNNLQQPRRVLNGVRPAARPAEVGPRPKESFAFETPLVVEAPAEDLSTRLMQLAGEMSCRGTWQAEGMSAVTQEVAKQIGAVRVLLFDRNTTLRQSGTGRIDPNSELGQAIRAVARRAATTKADVPSCHVSSDEASPLNLALQSLVKLTNSPVAFAAILPAQRTSFIVLAWGDISAANSVPKLLAAATPLTNLLAGWQGNRQRGSISRALEWTSSNRNKAIIAATLLVAALLCIPFPYHVSCSATIEPPVRSYLEAPFDGSLSKTLVHPGDHVEVGQILAQLDDRQMQLDLVASTAAVEESLKRLQAARAKQDGSAALLAELDLKQARVKLQILRERERRLLVTSPIDGFVIRGDLRRVEGSSVKQGQTLFEVAAGGEMLAELEVPEAEIAYVREEMPVTIHLTSLSQSLRGIVRRIHPRAQLKNEASIFLVEVELDEASKAVTELRPGMHGSASITADSYPLGWNLLHRPWQALRRAWEG